MEKFNAKDYIIGDVQELTRQKTNGTNFTVKLLPDGKKGFIISRTKKRMTVDYENYRILDSKIRQRILVTSVVSKLSDSTGLPS